MSRSGCSECGRATVSEIVVSDTAGVLPACETEFGEPAVTDEYGACLMTPVKLEFKNRSPEHAHSVWLDLSPNGYSTNSACAVAGCKSVTEVLAEVDTATLALESGIFVVTGPV